MEKEAVNVTFVSSDTVVLKYIFMLVLLTEVTVVVWWSEKLTETKLCDHV